MIQKQTRPWLWKQIPTWSIKLFFTLKHDDAWEATREHRHEHSLFFLLLFLLLLFSRRSQVLFLIFSQHSTVKWCQEEEQYFTMNEEFSTRMRTKEQNGSEQLAGVRKTIRVAGKRKKEKKFGLFSEFKNSEKKS